MANKYLVRTMAFPKSWCVDLILLFLLAEGGWGTTLWKTSEKVMMISLPLPCYSIKNRRSFSAGG
jgi:hypothetical protein